MTAPLTLNAEETADQLNLSVDRWRKVWKVYVATRGFPAPFRSPPLGNYAWDAGEVEAWRRLRARCGVEAAPPPANDGDASHLRGDFLHPMDRLAPPGGLATNPRLQRERAELRAMMKRGA